MSELTRSEAKERWTRMVLNLHHMERSVLQLILHPDTTPEQLMNARTTYMQVFSSMENAALQLTTRFPPQPLLAVLAPDRDAWGFQSLSGVYARVVQRKAG